MPSPSSLPPTNLPVRRAGGESGAFKAPEWGSTRADYESSRSSTPRRTARGCRCSSSTARARSSTASNPTLLYGYGGFNISLTPGVLGQPRWRGWSMGGVFALANLRGGGEYGEDWHQAGHEARQQAERLRRLHRRRRVADRREVHARRRSSRSRAAATAACWSAPCMTQRPDLFGACLPAVGVMDMLRFHKFTDRPVLGRRLRLVGRPGRSSRRCYAYSPLPQPASRARSYPATLVTTADHDDRVVPAHSFKFAAALQAARPARRRSWSASRPAPATARASRRPSRSTSALMCSPFSLTSSRWTCEGQYRRGATSRAACSAHIAARRRHRWSVPAAGRRSTT